MSYDHGCLREMLVYNVKVSYPDADVKKNSCWLILIHASEL